MSGKIITVPTVVDIRRRASEGVSTFKSFVSGLDQFGREPGEPWHSLADEMIGRFLALEKCVERLKRKGSLPSAERAAIALEVDDARNRMKVLRDQLLEDISAACPATDRLEAPDAKTRILWFTYDRMVERTGVRRFERSRIQGMLRRAHTPAAVLQLVTGHHDGEDFGVWADLFQGFQTLLMTTPLPRFEDRSVMQMQQDARKHILSKDRDPERRDDFFDRFVAGILSPRPEERKQARRALEKLRSRTWEERNGPMMGKEMAESRKMLAVWDGVRAALGHSDPVYRRAALCALPILQFTFILTDFADEMVAFILKGLQDPDGTTRFKVMRCGHDFFMAARTDMPEIAASLEKQVRELRRRLLRTHPEAAETIGKLIKGIDWFHQYDRQMRIGLNK